MTEGSALDQLMEQNPEVATLMGSYAALENVYRGGLRAMGLDNRPQQSVRNSADVSLTFTPDSAAHYS